MNPANEFKTEIDKLVAHYNSCDLSSQAIRTQILLIEDLIGCNILTLLNNNPKLGVSHILNRYTNPLPYPDPIVKNLTRLKADIISFLSLLWNIIDDMDDPEQQEVFKTNWIKPILQTCHARESWWNEFL